MFNLIGLILAAGTAAATTVDTEVTAAGAASYFYEEHHPTKMDWSSFTLCWGKNSDSQNDRFQTAATSRNANSGSWTVFNDVNASRGRLTSLVNQNLEWNSVFDQREYVFHVRFKKKVGDTVRIRSESTCSTRSWQYVVDEANSKIVTSVRLVVPTNTWVLRIRPQVNIASAISTIEKVSAIGSVDHTPESAAGSITSDGTHYFFVKPGDEVKITLTHEDVRSSLELLADYEVTFIGHNRCEKAVDDFKALAGQSARVPIKKELVDQGFRRILDGVRDGQLANEAGIHEGLLFLGCLTSDAVVGKVLYENDTHQILSILDGVQAASDELEDRLTSAPANTRERARMTERLKPFKVVVEMARYAVSESTLRSIAPLCERYPYIVNHRIRGNMTGYFFMRQKMDSVAIKLGLAPRAGEAASGIDRYFRQLVDSMGRASGHTYSEFIRARRSEIMSLAQDYEANAKLAVLESAIGEVDQLPGLRPTRNIEDMVKGLRSLKDAIHRINREFYRQIDLFANEAPQRVDVSLLAQAVADFETAFKQTQENFQAVYRLVDVNDNNITRLANTLGALESIHLREAEIWLNSKYGGFLAGFVQFHRGRSQDALEGLSQCILHPITLER